MTLALAGDRSLPEVMRARGYVQLRDGTWVGPKSPLLELERKKQRDAAGSAEAPTEGRFADPIDPHGKMNKWERVHAGELESLKLGGEIRAWRFEGIALRLADRTLYHPDFLVTLKDGSFRIDEVKGFMRDDAAVKLKVAARLFPEMRFMLWRRKRKAQGGGWVMTEISG